MGDLISKGALIKRYIDKCCGVCYRCLYETEGYGCALIEDAPTVEAEPVVHGEWIKLDMHRGMANHKCSVCKQECYVPTCMGEPMYCYCPNCGATMDGKSKV